MKNSKSEEVKGKILTQLKDYLQELNSTRNSSANDYVSTEAYNGVEYAFVYQMIGSIRAIVENKSNGGNDAIFFDNDDPKKRIEKRKVISFLSNEISNVHAITSGLSESTLNQFLAGFSDRVMQLKS